MNTTILSSTFLLTVLLAVGLFFFIRASTKERTQEIKLVSNQGEDSVMSQLQQYLQKRSYHVTSIDAEHNSVTFEGFVRPSIFLAIFLTLLAATGLLCLALVLSLLFPSVRGIFLILVLLSPTAGVFYWSKAGRKEQVLLKLEATTSDKSPQRSQVTVVAHRDELLELQRSLQLESLK